MYMSIDVRIIEKRFRELCRESMTINEMFNNQNEPTIIKAIDNWKYNRFMLLRMLGIIDDKSRKGVYNDAQYDTKLIN